MEDRIVALLVVGLILFALAAGLLCLVGWAVRQLVRETIVASREQRDAMREMRTMLVEEHRDMASFLQFTTDPAKWLIRQQALEDAKEPKPAPAGEDEDEQARRPVVA